MGQPLQKARGEREKKEITIQDFGGVNVQSPRYSIKDNEFRWLENVMPVAPGTLACIPVASSVVSSITAQTVVSSFSFNALSGVGSSAVATDYIAAFTAAGNLYVAPYPFTTFTQYGSNGTFSASGVVGVQWKNERLLIGDPSKGYFSWDPNAGLTSSGGVANCAITAGGTGYTGPFTVTFSGGGGSGAQGTATVVNGVVTTVTMTSPGSGYTSAPTPSFAAGGGSGATATVSLMAGPSKISSIACYAGRVWCAYQRTITYSDISQSNNFYSFSGGSSGSLTIADSTLHSTIFQLTTANNFLYVFGDDSIDVIGDVQVVSGTTTFTRTNLTASIGTSQAASVFPYYRSLMFAGSVGFYELPGAVPEKRSANLDGFYTQIQFASGIQGGQVSINNILCAAFICTFKDIFTSVGGTRTIFALYFDKKWFFSSQGPAVTVLCPATVSGVPMLYGWAGGSLYQLFTNSSSTLNTIIQTKLYSGNAPTLDKAALKLGVGVTFANTQIQSVSGTIDNERKSVSVFTNLGNTIQWVNNSFQNITFINNSSQPLNWTAGGYIFQYGDAPISGGKYLGATISGSSYPYILNEILIEYEEGARW